MDICIDYIEAIYMFFGLIVLAQFKHFIADYPLQGPYMLGKFKEKGWVKPLAAHAGVHFLFTSAIACSALSFKFGFGPLVPITAGLLGLLDFVVHFIMDRIKASPKMLGRYKALSKDEMIQIMKNENLAKGILATSDFVLLDYQVEIYNDLLKEINQAKKDNTYFWWSLGLDQTVHHLTDVVIAFLLIKIMYGV